MVASFHDLAKVELNEAAQYYEAENSGLGAAFLAEVERSVAAVVEHPDAGQVRSHQWLRAAAYASAVSVRPPVSGARRPDSYLGRHESQAPAGVLGRPHLIGSPTCAGADAVRRCHGDGTRRGSFGPLGRQAGGKMIFCP